MATTYSDDVVADELRDWPHLPKADLCDRMSRVVAELFGCYQEAALCELEERKAKVNAYARSEASSTTARDRDAAAQALPATMQLIELRGRIAALENAREYGYVLLGLGA